ncbi:hypothetical protein A9G09_02815 [Gilliamella sp. wkB292]|nr:hypothetical protein A9G09_02815 [Gilliamella apicola]
MVKRKPMLITLLFTWCFSFCRLIGKSTQKPGVIGPMMFHLVRILVKLAISPYWLAIYLELDIVASGNYSFEPFPDKGRVLPFGLDRVIFILMSI